jgi:8-amino-7-oxononanoate synthase
LRSLSCFDGFIDFFSNDYLGLANSVIPRDIEKNGSTGSRLISGNSKEAIQCEQTLAKFFDSDAALVFNSGYDANIGLFSALLQRGDTIIYDEAIHASVRDGIRLSYASAFSFKHNSVEDLRLKLNQAKGTVYIAVESLYSMNGDLSPLTEIAKIAKEKNAFLIVDEAHSCGVLGENGKGLIHELKLEKHVFARLITFGKAYGCHGAAVLGSEMLKEYLINFSRSFIYTTALPPSGYALIEHQVLNQSITEKQEKLKEVILYFREELKGLSHVSDERSPIQMIRISDVEKTKVLANELVNHNFAVKPIFSPTVPKGEESIRICLHAYNTEEEIKYLCKTISELV